MKKIAINKRARFDYEILEKFEAGLVLKGFETKAVKTGRISLKGSFVTIRGQELYLTNANIPLYQHAGAMEGHDPTRPRKLLMHKKEISRLIGKARTEGLTMIPLSVYNKKNLLKLEFALAKGKKTRDKREDIKKREDKIRVEREMRNRG